MLTIRPGDLSSISRLATSQDRMKGARRLMSITRSISSMDILVARWASGMPALLIRMVTGPSAASTVGTMDVSWSVSVTSRTKAAASPPWLRISSARASSRSVRRAASATLAPAAASTRAKRRPRPDEAPVTSAVWPVRLVEMLGMG